MRDVFEAGGEGYLRHRFGGESVIAEDGTSTHYVYAVVGNGQKPIPKIDNGNGNLPRLHTIPAQIESPFYGNCMVKLTLVADNPLRRGEKLSVTLEGRGLATDATWDLEVPASGSTRHEVSVKLGEKIAAGRHVIRVRRSIRRGS